MNWRQKNSEKITSSPSKRKLQQEQNKITKTNKNQIKPKQKKKQAKNKIETKITSKTKKQKSPLKKKKIMLASKNWLALPAAGLGKRVK